MGNYIGLSPALTEIQNNVLNTANALTDLNASVLNATNALGYASTSRVISSNDNITTEDYLILADTSSGSIILTLPLISASLGRKFLIKNIGNHELRINTFGVSDKIENNNNLFIILSEQYSAINLMSSSNNIWYIY